jgi:glycosyltransferase involved in cell wall biosynthesis
MRESPSSIAPVRVLINGIHAKSGGGVTYLRAVLPWLSGDPRLDLVLLLHRSQLPLFERIDPAITIELLDLPGGMGREMAWEQLELPVLARRLGAQVVFSPANFGPLALARQVIMLRNDVTVARSEPRLAKKLYWAALSVLTFLSLLRARRAVAVSAYAAQALSFGCGRLFGRKVRVVYHGVDPAFSPDAAVPREDFLLTVSDVYVQKNLQGLVRALVRLPDVELRVAGKIVDPWYHRETMALAKTLGVDKRIVFLGRQEPAALIDLYRRCKVFVFPSTAETFGNPLVEAMACGAVVACSNAAAMPEVVGDAAVLFDPHDPQQMADVVGRLWRDENLRRDLTARALVRAQAFSWSRTARATADLLIEAAR